jgi:uncharacterized protein YdhG (YjbR/CyaY superfamily)
MKDVKTIDNYIKSFSKEVQVILNKYRETIKSVAPNAEEKIGYGIPTFTLNGKNLVHFAAFAKHTSFFPGGGEAVEAFKNELKPYETSKGTIKFPIKSPVPFDLIKKITKYRLEKISK